jgi:serine/threonine-protein kinase
MTLVRVDRQGREEPIPAEPRPYGYPRISPDGTQVAVASIGDEQNQAIWVWDLAKANLTKLTFAPDNFVSPVWGSDGKSVVFAGRDAIERQSASGAGRPERIVTRIGTVLPDAMTPDGTSLVVRHRVTDTGWNLELVSMEGDHRVTPLLSTPFNERFADLSPDGRLIAYQSDESGPDEIYVRPFPRVDDGKWQVSRGGGSTPVWSRNGRELFYLAPGGRMMAVAVQTQPTFSWSPPVKLFEGSFRSHSEARHFDVTPDGRFLMIKQSGGSGDAPRLIVVEHWLDELERRVPTK